MNSSVRKKIVGISKSGLWRVTCKRSWFSLEQKAIIGFVKVNETDCKERLDKWCKNFNIIRL